MICEWCEVCRVWLQNVADRAELRCTSPRDTVVYRSDDRSIFGAALLALELVRACIGHSSEIPTVIVFQKQTSQFFIYVSCLIYIARVISSLSTSSFQRHRHHGTP